MTVATCTQHTKCACFMFLVYCNFQWYIAHCFYINFAELTVKIYSIFSKCVFLYWVCLYCTLVLSYVHSYLTQNTMYLHISNRYVHYNVYFRQHVLVSNTEIIPNGVNQQHGFLLKEFSSNQSKNMFFSAVKLFRFSVY